MIASRVGGWSGIGLAPIARNAAGRPMTMPSTATVASSPVRRWPVGERGGVHRSMPPSARMSRADASPVTGIEFRPMIPRNLRS